MSFVHLIINPNQDENKIKLPRFGIDGRDVVVVNTGFNCCPGELYCSFSMISDTIVIKESEKSALCHCNCLFDMDIEITGVATRKYQVKVVEPYAVEMEKLVFEINLVEEPEGSFCVTRKNYPWGVSQW